MDFLNVSGASRADSLSTGLSAPSGSAGGFVGHKTYTCSPETFRVRNQAAGNRFGMPYTLTATCRSNDMIRTWTNANP